MAANFINCLAEAQGLQPTVDAVRILAPDVEYRLREVIQEAVKFSRHAKRTEVTVEDVKDSLKLRNVEPIHGFGGRDTSRFIKAAGQSDIYLVEDPPQPIASIIPTPLPPTPWEADVSIHWLAVDGIQPAIPENAPLAPIHASKRRKTADGEITANGGALHPLLQQPHMNGVAAAIGGGPALGALQAAAGGPNNTAAASLDGLVRTGGVSIGQIPQDEGSLVRAPFKHLVSKELLLYYDKVARYLDVDSSSGSDTNGGGFHYQQQPNSKQMHALLASLTSDPGLQPLVPYLCRLISDLVAKYFHSADHLHTILSVVPCIATNPHLDLSPYLHQLLPAVLSCLLSRNLATASNDTSVDIGKKNNSNKKKNVIESGEHWSVRDHAASVLAKLCGAYEKLAPRVKKDLVGIVRDSTQSLPTLYGAVVGIYAFGPRAIKTLLLPNLIPCVISLDAAVAAAKAAKTNDITNKNNASASLTIITSEAQHVRFALIKAAGYCVYKSNACRRSSEKPRALQPIITKEILRKEHHHLGAGGKAATQKQPKLDPVALQNPTLDNAASEKTGKGTKKATAKRPAAGGNKKGRGATTKKSSSAANDDGENPGLDFFFGEDNDDENQGNDAMDVDGTSTAVKSGSLCHPVNQGKSDQVYGIDASTTGNSTSVVLKENKLGDAWKEDFEWDVLHQTLSQVFGSDMEAFYASDMLLGYDV